MAYVPTAKLAPTNDDEDDDSCDPAEEVQRRAAVLSEQLGLGSVRLVDLAVTQAVDLQLALAGVDCVYVEGECHPAVNRQPSRVRAVGCCDGCGGGGRPHTQPRNQ